MKMAKFCACIAAGLVSTLALADAANVCITFSTTGPDKYADGNTVENGEWYALVWLADDAAFGGVTTQLEAVADPLLNEVMLAAPLAVGGRCPLVMWQVDSAKAKTSGTYTVVMLDTRGSDGKPAGVGEDGKPAVVYATMATDAKVIAKKDIKIASQTGSGVAEGSKVAAAGDAGAERPTIEAFEILGDNVKITVSGMVPGLTYKVASGALPTEMTTGEFEVEQDTGVVLMPVSNATFFSIKAE